MMKDQIKMLALCVIALSVVVQTLVDIVSGTSPNQVAVTQLADDNPQQTVEANSPEAKQMQQADEGPKTTMSFEKTEHDFGTIPQNEKVRYAFKFTNTGSNPLIIKKARGSCGCTVPDWPKEPISPGEGDEIVVEFSSGKRVGNQRKTVTVEANTDPSPVRLQIKANVTADTKPS